MFTFPLNKHECAVAAVQMIKGFTFDGHGGFEKWIVFHDKLRELAGDDAYDFVNDKVHYGQGNAYASAAALLSAFRWSEQPEGEMYWSEVHGDLCAVGQKLGCKDTFDFATPEPAVVKLTPKAKKRTRITPDSIAAWLVKKGYTKLGSGAYSSVYAHPSEPDTVIKVNRRADDWPVYIKWAEDNGYAGTFAPKVHALKVFKTKSDHFYIAKVERLSQTVSEICGYDDYGSALAKEQGFYRDVLDGDHGDASFDPGSLDEAVYQAKRDWSDRTRPGMYDFLIKLSDRFSCFDAHKGNWMVDEDVTRLVLTDPLTDNGELTCSNEVRIKSTGPVFALAA